MAINAASLIMNVSADTSAAERSLSNLQNRATSSFNTIASGAQSAGSSIGSMFDVAGGVAAAQMFQGAINSVRNFAQEAQNAYAFSERLGMSLQTMASKEMIDAGLAGSMTELRQMPELMGQAAGRAKELQDWMEKLAIQSPFKYEDVADAMRLSMAYGFTSTQAQRLTKTMSDFTAGTGQSGVAIKRMTLALGQIQARGKVATQEINQLSEVGVNARGILAKAFNKTTPEIIDMIEKGLVPADQAIEAIVSSLENDFGSAAESQSESMSGMMASFEDLQSLTARDLFSGIFKSIQPFMAMVISTLTDPKIKDQIKQFGVDIGAQVAGALDLATGAVQRFYAAFKEAGSGVTGIIKGIGAALQIPEWVATLGTFIASWALLTPVLAGIGRAIIAFGASASGVLAALTGPVGLLAAAIIGLGLAWTTNFMGIQDAMAPVVKTIGDVATALNMVFSMISSGLYTEGQLDFLTKAFGAENAKQILVFADNLRTAILAVNGFIQQMVSATGPIQTTWNSFSQTVVSAWNSVIGVFTKVNAAFSTFFDSSTWTQLTTMAGAAAIFIKQAFSNLFGGEMTLTEFTKRLGTALSSLAAMIGSAISSPDFAALRDGLASALGLEDISLDGIKQGIQGFIQTVSGLFTSIDWGGIIGDVSGALQLLATGIVGMIASIDWGAAMNSYGELWGGLIGSVITSIINIDWGTALTNAATVFGALTTAIVAGVTAIDWGGALTAVGAWYQGFIDGLVASLQTVDWGTNLANAATWLDGVKTWITEGITAIDWGGALAAVTTFTGGIVTWVVDAIQSVDWGGGITAAGVTLGGMASAVIDTIGKIDWGTLLTGYGTLWGTLVGSLIASIANIDWSGGEGGTGVDFAGMVNAIINKISSIDWGGILSGASTIFAGFVAFVVGGIMSINWGEALAAVGEWYQGFSSALMAELSKIDWGKNFTSATTWLDGLITQVTDGVSKIDWGKALATVTTWTGGLVSWIVSSIQSIKWGEGLTAAGVTLDSMATAVIDGIQKINWGTLLTGYGELWGGLVGGLIATIANIKWDSEGEGGINFAGFINAVINKVAAINWGAEIAAFGGFFDGFSSAMLAQIQGINWGEKMNAATAGAGNIADSIGAQMKSIQDNALTKMTATVEGMDLTKVLTGLIDGITNAITTADFSAIGSAFATALSAVFTVAGSLDFSGPADLVKSAVNLSLQGISWDTSSSKFDKLKAAIKTAWDNVDWTTVNASMDKLKTAVSGAMEGIVAGFKTSWDGSVAALKWEEIVGVFSWDTWLDALVWPTDIFSFSWSSFVPSITWPTEIFSFPGWEALIKGLGISLPGSAPSGSSAKDYGGSPYGTSKGGAWWNPFDGNAAGTDSWKGGMTWVGEKGPELMDLPKGTRIFNNKDSVRLIDSLAAMGKDGIPGLAEGTTSLPVPPLQSLRLGAPAAPAAPIGMSSPINPSTITQPIVQAGTDAMAQTAAAGTSFLGQDGAFASSATTAMETAASNTESAFKKTADAFKNDLKGALQQVPGLFGKSQVTDQQMKLAKLGVPQNFADDWLRQLTDEVVNGVDWGGVDIKDAASRAGIDPNLPKEIILEMVTQMWEDSSLFADPKNLDLINMKAVGDSIAKQQAAASGQNNLMALFGITPEGSQQQADAAVNGMMSNFAAALQGGQVTALGTQTMTTLAAGMGAVTPETTAALTTAMSTQLSTVSDVGTTQIADNIATSVGDAIAKSVGGSGAVTAFMEAMGGEFKSDESKTYLSSVGAAIAEYVFVGYKKAAAEMPWADAIPPAGNAGQSNTGTPTGTTTPPGNAAGTSFWRGGYTIVGERGPELVRLPKASRIWSNSDTQSMLGQGGGDVVIESVNIHNGMDVAQLEYRIKQLKRRRGK